MIAAAPLCFLFFLAASHAGDKAPNYRNSAPKRIISLAPSLGELAADLAGNDIERIVGVTEYTDYPPALLKVPSVGPYSHFNLEKVISLKPDLVLATKDGNSKDQVEHLRELGINVVVVETEDFRGVEESIRSVSKAMGEQDRGEAMISQFKKGLENIRERARIRTGSGLNIGERPKVLLQLSADPLIVVGNKSFLHDALETVGAVNTYSDSNVRYPRPSVEDAVKRQPDIILVLALGRELRPFREMARQWARFSSIPAVKNKRIFVLQGDPILRPTLRLLEGLSLLEKSIYGSK